MITNDGPSSTIAGFYHFIISIMCLVTSFARRKKGKRERNEDWNGIKTRLTGYIGIIAQVELIYVTSLPFLVLVVAVVVVVEVTLHFFDGVGHDSACPASRFPERPFISSVCPSARQSLDD